VLDGSDLTISLRRLGATLICGSAATGNMMINIYVMYMSDGVVSSLSYMLLNTSSDNLTSLCK